VGGTSERPIEPVLPFDLGTPSAQVFEAFTGDMDLTREQRDILRGAIAGWTPPLLRSKATNFVPVPALLPHGTAPDARCR